MQLLVEDILEMKVMKNAKIIAGMTGLRNNISFITVMDVPGIIEWLHGGEIIFSAKLFDDCISEDFLLKLHKKSVSAVVTKCNYATKLNNHLKTLCDELCLPIITVERDVSWSDITNPIIQLIARKQYDAIYQSQLFHATLMHSLIHEESLDKLCSKILRTTNLTTAITDTDFNISGCSSNVEWEKVLINFSLYSNNYRSVLAKDINNTPTSGYVYTNLYLNSIGKQAFVFPVTQGSATYSYIFLLVNKDVKCLDITNSMKVGQLTLIIALAKARHLKIINITRRYRNLLFDRILRGKISNPVERSTIEDSIQKTFRDYYYVIVAHDNRTIDRNNIIEQGLRISNLFEDLGKNNCDFEDILCFEHGDDLVFLCPKNDIDIKITINHLYTTCKKTLQTNSLYFGISEPVKNTAIPLGFKHASQTLQYIKSYPKKNCCYYRDLGIIRLFMNDEGNIDREFLYDYKKRYVNPLRKYDEKNHTQLEETLCCLIKNNYSKNTTARELFIHNNTLRARISRIEKILDCDLGNSEDMFNLQLATKIDYCFTE